ncbi:ectoine hydroxylase [Lentzea sp. CA-135723]|uniref:ectoine hydroxylase n=1 Tax=Lentzea sp. CA-135723 TaxID=3239950 RepID=UPI003D91558C
MGEPTWAGVWPGQATDPYPTRQGGPSREIPRTGQVVFGKPEDGPLTEEELDAFDRDGFLVLPNALDQNEVTTLLTELRRLTRSGDDVGTDRMIEEPDGRSVKSIYQVQAVSEILRGLTEHSTFVDRARQILGSDVYLHQTRANVKPGFTGTDFFWHSDFETWHSEDGLPTMRALSVSVSLTDNYDFNGPLMVMPGSHKTFVTGMGETRPINWKRSLRDQDVGVPDHAILTELADRHGIRQFTGKAGDAVMFDCNIMHGSNANITPFARSNIFIVYNSMENTLQAPFGTQSQRPEYLGSRNFAPVGR